MTAGAAVCPVRTARQRRAFVALPYALHRRDRNWPPLLRRDVRSLLDSRRNLFFDHGEAAYFLARRNGAVAGRIAAIRNRLHQQAHGDGAGFFGFFESEDDPHTAAALLDAAGDWLRARGLRVLRGPLSFSINDDAGLLVDGFDTPAALMRNGLERMGFRAYKTYLVYERPL